MSKKTVSVATKLAFRFTFIIAAVVFLLTFAFYRMQIAELNTQKNTDLQRTVAMIDRNIARYLSGETDELTLRHVPKHIYYAVYLAENDVQELLTTNIEDVNFLSTLSQSKNGENKDLKILYYSRLSENNKKIIIQTWIDLKNDSVYQMKQALPKLMLISLIPVLVICYFIAYAIAKNILWPVVKMTDGAKHISSTNLDTLLPIKNNGDELDQLALTFNDLFRRLKIDFDRERQFTSDVSHELKTPVAVILGQANLLRRWGKDDPQQLEKSIGTIISETKSMEAIIQNLLQMTRIESGKILPAKEEFYFSELSSKISEEIKTLDSSAEFKFNFDEKLSFNTDFELLHQVMMIIISNSLKFCQKPISLVINGTLDKTSGRKMISISDNGHGFAPEIMDHVFERFYRGDDAHTRSVGGSGLGLSIAKTIVESLDGTITACNDSTTGGAKITILL